ncbi:2-amino-4-hydroxy-6-hydroxymethyldihydropteridine diphosphokinase [Halieaceae bacterium IMCC14734]|uniref:2-amino-4-hydroxy-6-hydroxymethyldihydropteridine pyrophosphokinase n=1 Tax=Candidatus Litorirhabdus singularis TaxID=2518993 RepID=A0ABT3TMX1_9GAMM|nr:2-amino-4-hydroxy-6-hydroxymethyldihydropteridine diphosphokinase [Candidatus Litorirhabdus singularis]MCX2983086.1 2-amino-4-hydroxy-6-hydroxymethyldihydropteridine diphosphokinase [Candidatus Litorirhabdus singularis]
MSCAYIALGSNLDKPQQQVLQALQDLDALPGCSVQDTSPLYTSAAVGPGAQPDYVNAVTQIDTTLAPHALLSSLQAIEDSHGRRREVRWGARTLDLDLLLYDAITLQTAQLEIPHPRLQDRNFVLYPLHDISPTLTLPCGTPIASLLARCPRDSLRLLTGGTGAA